MSLSSAPAGSLHGFIQGWLRGSMMCGCFGWVSWSSAPAGSLHGFIQGGPSFQGWLAALIGCIPWLVSMVSCWFLHAYVLAWFCRSHWLVKVAHGDLLEEAKCVMHGQLQRGFPSAFPCMVHAILVGGSSMVSFRQLLAWFMQPWLLLCSG